MAGLEHFKFGHDAGVFDRYRHRLQMLGRVDKHAVSHVEATHIKAANVGLEFDYMAHALFGGFEHALGTWFRGVAIVMCEAGTRPGGEVDEDISVACSDPLDDLAVKCRVHTRLGGFRIAHMDMHDGSARLGRIDR